jgi:hypothetical protein
MIFDKLLKEHDEEQGLLRNSSDEVSPLLREESKHKERKNSKSLNHDWSEDDNDNRCMKS